MKFTPIGVLINDVRTDIVVSRFRNITFILVTQFKKPGCIIEVKKKDVPSNHAGNLYLTYQVLGTDDSYTSIARFLTEELGSSEALIVLSLKDFSAPTVRAIRDLLIKHKTW